MIFHLSRLAETRAAIGGRVSVSTGMSAALLLLCSACAKLDNIERKVTEPAVFAASSTSRAEAVDSPIKAHMPDGSVYVFSSWMIDDSARAIRGTGQYFGTLREELRSGDLEVALDSVALVETNVRSTSGSQAYLMVLTGASVAVAAYCAANVKACFGSCPTIYADGMLEAESFSHSIVPLFEMRDVDRLAALPSSEGILTLEVRNEALETHYINHLELLQVEHPLGAYAVPGPDGDALVFDGFAAVSGARDRSGRSVDDVLAAKDDVLYRTPDDVLRGAARDDPFDHIDLEVPWNGARTAAVLLNLRASLLGTVLFYDFMLKGRGPGAIDWLTRELDTIEGAVDVGQFYTRWMGIRISVEEEGTFREVGRLGGAGPVAWDEAALVLPVAAHTDTLRIRLSFLADAFHIDRAAVASRVERAPVRAVPLTNLRTNGSMDEQELHVGIRGPDEVYAVTYPGSSFEVEFDLEHDGAGRDAEAELRDGAPVCTDRDSEACRERTYFVAAQGYYIEWIRRDWLRDAHLPSRQLRGEPLVRAALERWAEVKEGYEEVFFETNIPVR